MRQNNSTRFVTGLVFVIVFLFIVASSREVANHISMPPTASYELAGNSKPVK